MAYVVSGTIKIKGRPASDGTSVEIWAFDGAGGAELVATVQVSGGRGSYSVNVPDGVRSYRALYDDGTNRGVSAADIPVVIGTDPKLFVIAGQSNAEGYGSASALTDPSYAASFATIPIVMQAAVRQDPITWRYYDGSTIHTGSGVDNPPSTFGDVAPHFFPGVNPDNVGPECSLVRELDPSVISRVAKFTLAGSNLATDWLNPAYPSGGPALKAQWQAFIDAAVTATGLQVGAAYWNQGENDAKLSADASVYAANMKTLWDDFFTKYPRCPLIVAKLNGSLTAVTYPYRDTVRTQQTAFVNTYPWATLIDCDDLALGGDATHYTADSQVVIGQRVAAAYDAALLTTTLSASMTDSDDPLVADGRAFNYAINVTNTGARAADNVAVVVTLPAGVGYTSGVGTGWTFAAAGQVVTCTRASGAVGALPAITINCTAPGSVGSGSMTATASIVASNVQTKTSLSVDTTLDAPAVTSDSSSGVYLPQDATEYGAMITSGSLAISAPDEIVHLGAALSGNAIGSILGLQFVASGTNGTYNQALAGWAAKVFKWINAATAKFECTDAALPDISTTSFAAMLLVNLSAAPSAPRGIVGFGTTSNYVQVSENTTPALAISDGANTATGTTNPTGAPAVRAMMAVHDRAAGQGRLYTDLEKLTVTIGTGTGKRIMVGNIPAITSAPPMGVIDLYLWFGAKAEQLTDANVKALINHQGNGYWAVPWS